MRVPYDKHIWHELRSAMQHEIALHSEKTMTRDTVACRLYALHEVSNCFR